MTTDIKCMTKHKLAEEATNEAVSILKRVAEGRRRTLLSRYDFQDQVYALERLVEFEREDVNSYIRQFLAESVAYENSGLTTNNLNIPTDGWDQHSFPNTSGELGERLSYRSDVSWELGGTACRESDVCWAIGGTECPEEGYYRRPTVRDEEAHKARESILSKIKSQTSTTT